MLNEFLYIFIHNNLPTALVELVQLQVGLLLVDNRGMRTAFYINLIENEV